MKRRDNKPAFMSRTLTAEIEWQRHVDAALLRAPSEAEIFSSMSIDLYILISCATVRRNAA